MRELAEIAIGWPSMAGVDRSDWSMAMEPGSLTFFDGVLSGISNGKSYYLKEDLILEMLAHLRMREPVFAKYFYAGQMSSRISAIRSAPSSISPARRGAVTCSPSRAPRPDRPGRAGRGRGRRRCHRWRQRMATLDVRHAPDGSGSGHRRAPSRASTRPRALHFRFAVFLATSRAQSMKSCATGLSARVFSVTIPFGTRAIGR